MTSTVAPRRGCRSFLGIGRQHPRNTTAIFADVAVSAQAFALLDRRTGNVTSWGAWAYGGSDNTSTFLLDLTHCAIAHAFLHHATHAVLAWST